ncbi:MAG: Mov34/MPN/PAD-1 family protein [Candidatus Hodarchaeales archaeon]
MTLVINENEIKKIRFHSEKTFPEECCGVLIGKKENGSVVLEARAMRNTNEGTRERRYNIDPIDLMKIDKEAEEKGFELLGIYHSHPNHPSRPSKFDLEHAWPNFSYIVLSVKDGKSDLLTSWKLKSDRSDFLQEKIKIISNN